MKKNYFCERLFSGFILFSLAILGSTVVLAQEENVAPNQPAAIPANKLNITSKDDDTPPIVTPIKGGVHIKWSTVTDIGGVRFLEPLAGKVEFMFDVPRENLDKKIEPAETPDVLVPLADYWIVRGKPERAIPLYRLGLTKEPNNIVFQNNLAMLLSTAEGNHEEGLKVIDAALEEHRDNVTLLDTKGIILMNDGRGNEAIPVLQRAVELSCQHPIYCLHLAKAYDLVGQATNARNWFDRSRPLLEAIPGKLTHENKNMFDDLRMKYPPEVSTTPNL
ncbi:MAG: hypothetical protein LBP87_01000 [Planctomycetaceae bacterium]|jgi:tetratricopeptide (TPR) repeat protein|nr:hypothetical protein [Planctomycetaceae bacterium]